MYNVCFTWRSMYIYISMNSSQNKKYFRQKLYRKSKLTFYADNVSENRAVYETMLKQTVQRLQYNTAHGLCMLDNRHTLGTCNISFFFHGNNGYANAPQCYVNGTLYVLLLSVQITQTITWYKLIGNLNRFIYAYVCNQRFIWCRYGVKNGLLSVYVLCA
jgi:hypothetical protein